MKKRKIYSKEFNLDVIALVRAQNYCTSEVARNLEVSARWIREAEMMLLEGTENQY